MCNEKGEDTGRRWKAEKDRLNKRMMKRTSKREQVMDQQRERERERERETGKNIECENT